MIDEIIDEVNRSKGKTANELPVSWQLIPLKDLVTVRGGKRLPKGAHFSSKSTSYPYIRVVDFANGSVKLDDLKFLTPEVYDQIKLYRIFKEDIYISIAGTIGLAGTIPLELDGANLTENAARLIIRDSNLLDKNYLALYLNGTQGQLQIEKLTSKTTQPKLALVRIESLEIPLPSLPEQRTIAHILQTAQIAIQARGKELELERERKAALMQHLFTHGTRGEATKMTKIGEIPANWEILTLGKICEIRYGLGQPPQKDDNGIPMIRATDIKNGRIVTKTVMRVNNDAIPEGRAYFLQKGDIIVVRSGVYAGDIAIYNGYWERAIAGYDLVVTPTNEDAISLFLSYYLQGETNQRYFRSQRDRSAQPHINADQLRNALIPLPFRDGQIDRKEQEEISHTLALCDSKIVALEKEITLQEELFHTLLEELMSGRLAALPLVEEPEKG